MQETGTFKEALAPNGIFYRLYGEDQPGLPLVMIMGYGGSMFAWPLPFISRLARKQKVLLFDNRGTGRSAPLLQEQELRMQHFAQDLRDLLSHLQFNAADIFGYSMGGCVSLQFAHQFPEIVSHIVLQSTSAGGELYTGSDPDVKERLANPRGNNFDEMFFDFFDLCMPESALKKHRILLEGICANARPYPTPLRVLQPQLKAFRNFDASKFVKDINHKTLLLHGKTDRILRVENGEQLSRHLPDCRSAFFDDCGHCPHIEYEDEVLNLIADFLGRS